VKTLADRLRIVDACPEAIDWANTLTHRSMQRAWDECPRADWLLWYAAERNVDRKKLVLAACACARTALKFVPKGELRPREAIETAEAWTRGEATIEEVRNVAAYAYAAAYVAQASAYKAADAASAAAYAAAYVAYDAAYAAAYAADAVHDAAYAAYAADAAARNKVHLRMCKLVRKILTKVPR
jgi:hypothetical protein